MTLLILLSACGGEGDESESSSPFGIQVRPESNMVVPTPSLTSSGELCQIEESGMLVKGDHEDFAAHVRYRFDWMESVTPVPAERQAHKAEIDYLRNCLGE